VKKFAKARVNGGSNYDSLEKMNIIIGFKIDVRMKIATALEKHLNSVIFKQLEKIETYENVSCLFPPKEWSRGSYISKKQFKLKTFLEKKGFNEEAKQLPTDKISLYLVLAFVSDPERFATLSSLGGEVEGSHLCHSASKKEEEGKNKHELEQDSNNTCVNIKHIIPDLRDINRKRAYCWGTEFCDCDKFTGAKYKCIRPGPRAQRVKNLVEKPKQNNMETSI
jgi:hypothetical protein